MHTIVENSLLIKLNQQAQQQKNMHLTELFANDKQRFSQYQMQFNDLLFDFSKQRVTKEILDNLIEVAEQLNLQQWIEKLFVGELINHTEQRAAMHWALRTPKPCDLTEPEQGLFTQVHQQLDKMQDLVDLISQGHFRGVTGEAICDVVNLGVGGSELGPLMAVHAMQDNKINSSHKINLHFASSMDGSQLSYLLTHLRAQTTLFIISSKSFTTVDTMSNAQTAYNWLLKQLGNNAQVKACHFIGICSSEKKMSEWGIVSQHQLNMWPWVGGRFSLWSCIGLPIALSIGMQGFKQLLAGAHAMDMHFKQTKWQQNLPVLMALIGFWNVNFLQINTQAVLPYDGRLKYLADYLQQLEMESNGKSVNRQGEPIDYQSCPIIWGNVGSNAQHAFYQLLHQGTQKVACDFIITAKRYLNAVSCNSQSVNELHHQHQLSQANCLAQSRLLAFGDAALLDVNSQTPNYKKYSGNQPSSTYVLSELSPFNLGMLLAAYEHKVFVQSVLWNLNPFDQWGVEKGKEIAQELLPALLEDKPSVDLDVSTIGLLDFIRNSRQ